MRAFLVSLITEAIVRAFHEIFKKPTSEDELVDPVDLERRTKFLDALKLYEPQDTP